jgi:fatty-acyl-CoA synthase
LIHGGRTVSWGEFGKRTNNLALAMLTGGALPGDKIAFYMRNQPEYSEAIAAGFKARLTHVNVNYRYVDHELTYLLDNSDATVVVYNAEFAAHVAAIRGKLPAVKQWIEVTDGYPGLDDATDFNDLVNSGSGDPLNIERSPDDMLFLYTGGTTGMPKGVMWRHEDLWLATGSGSNPRLGLGPSSDLASFLDRLQAISPPVNLPLPPMMHGTGLLSCVRAMTFGGTAVTLTGRSFEAPEALAAIQDHKVTALTIVGDAFARPMLDALDANAGKFDISSVQVISSSGVMWTREVKAGLLRHNEELLLADAFSSSEAIGLGASMMSKDQEI